MHIEISPCKWIDVKNKRQNPQDLPLKVGIGVDIGRAKKGVA
jgi:hypothetical protein